VVLASGAIANLQKDLLSQPRLSRKVIEYELIPQVHVTLGVGWGEASTNTTNMLPV
jgi:hypothetical protein